VTIDFNAITIRRWHWFNRFNIIKNAVGRNIQNIVSKLKVFANLGSKIFQCITVENRYATNAQIHFTKLFSAVLS